MENQYEEFAALYAENRVLGDAIAAAYETFFGGVPTVEGFTFLINRAIDAGIDGFNEENLYINVVNSLFQGNNEASEEFQVITSGSEGLAAQVEALYRDLVPAEDQTDNGLAYLTRPEALAFYQQVADERGVEGPDAAAVVAFASLLDIITREDIGLGDSVNDLFMAIQDGSALLPQDGNSLTPIETADGTNFDDDDAIGGGVGGGDGGAGGAGGGLPPAAFDVELNDEGVLTFTGNNGSSVSVSVNADGQLVFEQSGQIVTLENTGIIKSISNDGVVLVSMGENSFFINEGNGWSDNIVESEDLASEAQGYLLLSGFEGALNIDTDGEVSVVGGEGATLTRGFSLGDQSEFNLDNVDFQLESGSAITTQSKTDGLNINVEDVNFRSGADNSSNGITLSGTNTSLNIDDSSFSSFNAAIYDDVEGGSISVTGSTFNGNAAAIGGLGSNTGLSIANSTFTGNAEDLGVKGFETLGEFVLTDNSGLDTINVYQRTTERGEFSYEGNLALGEGDKSVVLVGAGNNVNEAIESANVGDIVAVGGAAEAGQVLVMKDLTIRGTDSTSSIEGLQAANEAIVDLYSLTIAGGTTGNGNTTETGLYAKGGSTINGFNLILDGSDATSDFAFAAVTETTSGDANSINLSGGEVRDWYYGVYVNDGGASTIDDVRFTGNSYANVGSQEAETLSVTNSVFVLDGSTIGFEFFQDKKYDSIDSLTLSNIDFIGSGQNAIYGTQGDGPLWVFSSLEALIDARDDGAFDGDAVDVTSADGGYFEPQSIENQSRLLFANDWNDSLIG